MGVGYGGGGGKAGAAGGGVKVPMVAWKTEDDGRVEEEELGI